MPSLFVHLLQHCNNSLVTISVVNCAFVDVHASRISDSISGIASRTLALTRADVVCARCQSVTATVGRQTLVDVLAAVRAGSDAGKTRIARAFA